MSILSRLFESKEAREERIEAKRLAEEAETKRAAEEIKTKRLAEQEEGKQRAELGSDDFMFWVARKDPDDVYLAALVKRMYREDPAQFPPKLVKALETLRVSFRTMWKEEEKRTYVWLQPPSEAAAERSEAKGIICDRCNQSSIQRMEGDKYWCSWCNDWALGVGTSGEGKPGRRFVPPSGAAAGSYCSNCGRYPLPEGSPRSPNGERVCNECWKSAPCVCFCRGCKKSFQSEAGMWRQYCPKCDAYWGGRVKDAFGGKYTGLR